MFGKMFPGGVHPREGANGKAVTGVKAATRMQAPDRVYIPLSQHTGAPAKALVKKGDRVLMGQKIGEAGGFVSAPVHSSVSGKVVDIAPVFMPAGNTVMAVVIDNDHLDEPAELHPVADPAAMDVKQLTDIIGEAGIVGMGGAAFPTKVKMLPPAGKTIEILIVNGCECEPYLSADHRLMLERAEDIIDGLSLCMSALKVGKAIIGVELNKPDAISALQSAASGKSGIEIVGLPVRYPEGGEKQLIYALTKRKVPCGGLPIDTGCVVLNVGTTCAIRDAVREGKPLYERYISVGGMVKEPGVRIVRVGTTMSDLIDACGGLTDDARKIISGGPMMGMAVSRIDIPVTKGTSGLTVLGDESLEPEETACIRCGRCVAACPMQLMPSKFDALMRLDRYEAAQAAGVMNCIECGACTYSCPAKRKLTQSIRTCKTVLRNRAAAAKAKAAAEAAAAAAKAEAEKPAEKKEA